MNIWNKVLLSFILIASLAFLYLAVKDLRLHREWGEKAKTLMGTAEEAGSIKEQLKKQGESLNSVATDGEDVAPGIRQLSIELNKLMLRRGRAWFNCQPENFAQGEVIVKTSFPNPNGIMAESVVHVFEQEPGSYLGQFTVTAVNPQKVQLRPSRTLTPKELDLVKTSQQSNKKGWALFESLPVVVSLPDDVADAPEFEELVRKQIENLSADEVVKCGLLDYEVLFREAHRMRSQAADILAAAAHDKQYLDKANEDAKLQDQFRRTEIEELGAMEKAVVDERAAVEVHRDNLRGKVDAMRTAITETLQKNSDLAGEIARRQLEASRKTDEQPPPQRMAQVAGR